MATKKEKIIAPVRGLWHIYGEDGSGKTIAALTTGVAPEDIIMIDDDSAKGRSLAEQIGMEEGENYFDLLSLTEGMNEVQFHTFMVEKFLPNLPNAEVLVWDNAKRFFSSGHSFIVKNWSKFREVVRGSGAIIGAYQWGVLREQWYPTIYANLLKKYRLVIITTHEKEQTDSSGVKTGALEPASDKSLRKAANVIIRLTKNHTGNPAPVGLVIKNMAKLQIPGGVQSVLPPRVDPFTWETVRRYLDNPVGNRELKENERPNEFELSLIEGSLTPEQKQVYEFNKRMKIINANEDLSSAVVELAAANVPPPMMIKRLADDYDIETDLATVQSILAATKGIG